MNLDPIDFFPGYDPYFCNRQRTRNSAFASIFTHLLAMLFAIGICSGLFYYYESYLRDEYDLLNNRNIHNKIHVNNIQKLEQEMENLKNEVQETNIWKKHLDELFTKSSVQQDMTVEKKIENALDTYDSDKIGLFDYASTYACGSVISTPNTFPYPNNKSISFFKLINMNMLSNPEALLQPSNLPGNCFAFYGTTGKIRIKLGKKVKIKSVTLDHIKIEDNTSAPKEFEVFGLNDPVELSGIFLGRFMYDIGGRQYQTFEINKNFTTNAFEFVELYILNNYGKQDFTCVYRFRVHDRHLKNSNNKNCPGCQIN